MKRLVLTVHKLAHSKSFNPIRRFASEEGDGIAGEKDLPLRYLPLKDRVMKTLRKKGYKIKEGHSNFIMKCPFCTRERRSLFVSKDSGDYYCQPCKLKGTWKQLTNWESLAKPNSTNKTASEEKIQQKQTPLICDTNKPPPTQEECKIKLDDGYLKSRTRKFSIKDKERLDKLTGTSCLAVSSLHLLDVRVEIPENIESEDLILAWPWFNNNFDQELVGVKIQHFGGVGRDGKQITYYPKDVKTGLFGWNTVAVQTKTVVITASELDAVALVQDCKASVLTLPQGVSALPPNLLPQLEVFDKVILWLGDDLRSKQASMQFAKKLNLKRCFTIRTQAGFDPEVPYTPLKLLDKGLNLGTILESALPMRNERILTFSDLRSEVWYELYHHKEICGLSWNRYPDLTKILKGYRRGEMSIYTGATGSGKTTLLSELSLDICMQNVPTLWGSFEIGSMRIAKIMLKQFSRLKLEESPDLFEEWSNKFQELPMYFMNFFGATSIVQILETMHYAVFMYDVEHVVVDNLQFMVGLEYHNDKYWVQDKIVAALRKFSTEKDVHISLIVHPRKERDDVILDKSYVYGTAKAIQEADNILIVHSNPGETKALEVCKNRFTGTLGFVRLVYNENDSTLSNGTSPEGLLSGMPVV